MKRKKLINQIVLYVAIVAAVFPSQLGLYQPKCPDSLKKYRKF